MFRCRQFYRSLWIGGRIGHVVSTLVIFGSVDEEDKGTAAIASWEKAEQVVGHLMKPTDFYPIRVHVTGYPTAGELAELGMATL